MRIYPLRWSLRLAAPGALLGYFIAAALLAALPAAGKKSRIKNTPTNDIAEQVLRDLVSTPLGKTMPSVRWEFFLIDDNRIAASSDGDGKIFVTTGMARWYLGKVRGVWAVVLGHEMCHALIMNPAYWPGFERELEKAEQQASRFAYTGQTTSPS